MSDSIIFNGFNLSDLVMCRMERPIMPPTELATEQVGGRHGALFRRTRMQDYVIPVTVWLRCEDRREVSALRHQLAALLYTEEPKPLYLPDEPDYYYLAIVEGDTLLGPITDDLPTTTINFRVCDPIAYGAAGSNTLSGSTRKTITTNGTFETRPIITSTTSNTSYWRFRNYTTGEYVEITPDSIGGELTTGKTVVCDMEKELVTLDGTNVGVSILSTFFALGRTQSLYVQGGTDTTIEWIERWI